MIDLSGLAGACIAVPGWAVLGVAGLLVAPRLAQRLRGRGEG